MGLFGFFNDQETIAGLDLGTSALRIVELDKEVNPHEVVSCLTIPWPEGTSLAQGISDPADLGETIRGMLAEHDLELDVVACAVPSPSVFTKRIRTPDLEWDALKAHIELEASSIIPQSGRGVKIDFHILNRLPKGQLEVLLVAAKQEAVDSVVATIEAAGLDLAVLDVDVFAAHNAFEAACGERLGQTVAIVNFGERFSSVSLRTKGNLAYAGDIPLGIKPTVDALAESLSMKPSEAERFLFGPPLAGGSVRDAVEAAVDGVCAELGRRLSLFWTVAEIEDSVETIVLSGGGSLITGLAERMSAKTSSEVTLLNPFSNFTLGEGTNIEGLPSRYAVATGLALRSFTDRISEAPGQE